MCSRRDNQWSRKHMLMCGIYTQGFSKGLQNALEHILGINAEFVFRRYKQLLTPFFFFYGNDFEIG